MPFQKTKLVVKGLLVVSVALLVSRFFWAWRTATLIAATVEHPVRMEFGPLGEADRLGQAVRKHIHVERWLPSSVFDLAFLPVRECKISSFGRMPGDLGRELEAFPRLQKIHIADRGGKETSESDWQRLLSRIRQFPELVELEVSGDQISDVALAPLNGHQRLRTLTIMGARLATDSLITFQSMPKLRQLYIFRNAGVGEVASPLYSEDLKRVLPNVTIEYSSN